MRGSSSLSRGFVRLAGEYRVFAPPCIFMDLMENKQLIIVRRFDEILASPLFGPECRYLTR